MPIPLPIKYVTCPTDGMKLRTSPRKKKKGITVILYKKPKMGGVSTPIALNSWNTFKNITKKKEKQQ